MNEANDTGFWEKFDPRTRIAGALVLMLTFSCVRHFSTLLISLAIAAVIVLPARLPLRLWWRRLLPFNLLVLQAFIFIPPAAQGPPYLWQWGSLSYAISGVELASQIALKGNLVLLVLIALLGRLEPVTFGQSLHMLGLPSKLTQLLLFTMRYIDTLFDQWRRMFDAAKVRGFRPGVNLHTYRSLAMMFGMLFVRSFERSERIFAAMQCRGFRGRFFSLASFRYRVYDGIFALGILLTVALVGYLDLAA